MLQRVAYAVVVSVVAAGLAVTPGGPAVAGAAARDRVAAPPLRPVDEPSSFPTDESDPAWARPVVTLPPVASAEVDIPESGWARAGSLPVSVALPSSGGAPSRVRVRTLSQEEVTAAGGRLLGFEVTRADGGATSANVAVALDYSGVEKAYGGDFASRLRLSRSGREVTARNDLDALTLRSSSLPIAADPSVAPATRDADSGLGPQNGSPLSPATYTVTAESAGPNGDYSASQLASSDSWDVGVGSGAFTYSVPIAMPPAPAGAAPSLSVGYSSQAVDGRSLAANGQVSKVGEGWGFEAGFIERKFHSCRDENVARDDLCWSADNEYFLHFMGRSGELVRPSATSNEWRLRGDPAWRVLSFTACCVNGDNNGEYWVLITPDGTKYWFGYGIEPRSNLVTNSAWTVPVYAGPGEECETLGWCQQAYRWNVDRVLDTNDNVISYFYAKEKNRYNRDGLVSTEYDRSGYLTWVRYGRRNGSEQNTAYARVELTVADRCFDQTGCPTPTPVNGSAYPDVPFDRMCTNTVQCAPDQTSPTFWSTKQYTRILTEFTDVTPASYQTVSIYRMTYSFPPTGDTTTPSLWLKDITRTGEYGAGATELPGVRMSGIALANRVNSGDGVAPLKKYRVASEPPRRVRRLRSLRVESDVTHVAEVLARDQGARGSAGGRGSRAAQVGVGGDRVGGRQARDHEPGDVAEVGPRRRGRRGAAAGGDERGV